jgi:hypothetical protein
MRLRDPLAAKPATYPLAALMGSPRRPPAGARGLFGSLQPALRAGSIAMGPGSGHERPEAAGAVGDRLGGQRVRVPSSELGNSLPGRELGTRTPSHVPQTREPKILRRASLLRMTRLRLGAAGSPSSDRRSFRSRRERRRQRRPGRPNRRGRSTGVSPARSGSPRSLPRSM